jgi:hypothetical protein
MISNKESTEKFIFISTHLMSWICFLSIFSVFLITIYRNFSRVNDIKVYIFLSAIFIFWYIPRSISYESNGKWLAFILSFLGSFSSAGLLYDSICNGWVI